MTAEMAADARAWLNDALEDRGWAQYNIDGGYFAQACFACQQSVEKLFKGLLLAYDVVFPKIHELVRLLDLCAEHDPAVRQFEGAARTLDQYYVATRYPDLVHSKRPYTEQEAREALELVDRMISVLRPIIDGRVEL